MSTFLAGQRLTASALNHMYGSGDATSRSVTAASETQLSSQYTIAANDAAVGTAYRLSCWGTGTQGSSPQSISFRANTIGGSGLNAVTTGSGFASASAQFRWWAEMICLASAIGSGGTITGFLRGAVEQISVTTGSVAFNSEWDGNSVNTAANWGIEIDCAWGSTSGAPTITCKGTLFERVG
jgi:hypothetical protein